jgi:hypothetical protein
LFFVDVIVVVVVVVCTAIVLSGLKPNARTRALAVPPETTVKDSCCITGSGYGAGYYGRAPDTSGPVL